MVEPNSGKLMGRDTIEELMLSRRSVGRHGGFGGWEIANSLGMILKGFWFPPGPVG